jgi:hypothetical protein
METENAGGGLKWVKDEIVASLQRIRESLDAFSDAPAGGANLFNAVTALNEIHGVLNAMQLPAPARLVEEMRRLCQCLGSRSLESDREAAEALMLALIQLPAYLDKLEAGRPEEPLVLLPVINDLRGSRGVRNLSEAEFLVPTSVLADSRSPSPEVQRALRRVVKKVRSHFHRCLVLWFDRETSSEGLVKLVRLFHQLQRYVQGGTFHELFLSAEAVLEAVLDGSMAADARTKALIARMDRVLKPFSESPDAWPQNEAHALLVDLLALIAACDSPSYLASELGRVYGLESDRPVGRAAGKRTTGIEGLAPPLGDPVLLSDGTAELAAVARLDEAALAVFRERASRHLIRLSDCASGLSAGAGSTEPVEEVEEVVQMLRMLSAEASAAGVTSAASLIAILERVFESSRHSSGAEAVLSTRELLLRATGALERRFASLPGGSEEIAALQVVARDAGRLLAGQKD